MEFQIHYSKEINSTMSDCIISEYCNIEINKNLQLMCDNTKVTGNLKEIEKNYNKRLSKSFEYIPKSLSMLNRKRSLSAPILRNTTISLKSFIKNEENPPEYTKSTQSLSSSSSCNTEAEFKEVCLILNKRPKSLNLTTAFAKSVHSSIRLIKNIGETSPNNYKEKFQEHSQSSSAALCMPPSAPLITEVPSSTDEEPTNDLRHQNPAFLINGSSGNFGSAGPRSAPATPQGQLGGSQGGLSESPNSNNTIQRSPSHSVFAKTDKSNLKHNLSASTPTMTAQLNLTEPPSPKAGKDPKVHTTSKARQKKFLRHFTNVKEDEKVLNHYSCALIGDILLQGHLYITKNYFAFYSNVFGYVTKLLIPILSVEEITKEKTARIIPNAVGITTSEDKHIFGSLMSRDSTLAYMKTVWEKAKSEEALPEPEIIEPELPDPDSSESAESGRESPTTLMEAVPPGAEVLASSKFDRIRKESALNNQIEGSNLERKGSNKGFIKSLKETITEFRKLPRQSLILVATTLLLILLFLSAAVLLYRINKIQTKYSSVSLQGSSFSATPEEIYSDLLQWQTHLHSRSAESVNNFLDSNLNQIAKVRESLETLSSLIAGQNSNRQMKEENSPISSSSSSSSSTENANSEPLSSSSGSKILGS